jgi:hypothetical protein
MENPTRCFLTNGAGKTGYSYVEDENYLLISHSVQKSTQNVSKTLI